MLNGTAVMIAETVSLGVLSLPSVLANIGLVPGIILIISLGLIGLARSPSVRYGANRYSIIYWLYHFSIQDGTPSCSQFRGCWRSAAWCLWSRVLRRSPCYTPDLRCFQSYLDILNRFKHHFGTYDLHDCLGSRCIGRVLLFQYTQDNGESVLFLDCRYVLEGLNDLCRCNANWLCM